MFEELFTMPDAIEKHQAAPLAEQRLRYLDHLAELVHRIRTGLAALFVALGTATALAHHHNVPSTP